MYKNVIVDDKTDSSEVNIKYIDKLILLKRLWEESKHAKTNLTNKTNALIKWNEELAIHRLLMYKYNKDYGNINLLFGRYIKSNITYDRVDTREYDKINGHGKFKKIVNDIREKYNDIKLK